MINMRRIINLKERISFAILSVLVILLSSFVSAFSVGVADLNLYPGQSYDIAYDVMNIVGEGELVVEGSFLKGSEIVSFTAGNEFTIPVGSVVSVPVRYRIPADAAVGTVYNVKVLFKSVSPGTGTGSVSFSQDVERNIKINVVPKPAEEPSINTTTEAEKETAGANVWLWVLGIIIIVIIIWFALKKKK